MKWFSAVRLAVAAAFVIGAYTETGIITAAAFFWVFYGNEMQAILNTWTIDMFDSQHKVLKNHNEVLLKHFTGEVPSGD